MPSDVPRTRGRRPSKPKINPATFETIIDNLRFPLERHELRELLIAICEEAEVRTHEGDGLLRKYRRRTINETVGAVVLRLRGEHSVSDRQEREE
jgi:hypothetical protein